MSEPPNFDDRSDNHLLKLRFRLSQNHDALELQKAGFESLHVPVNLLTQLADINQEIVLIDAELKKRNRSIITDAASR